MIVFETDAMCKEVMVRTDRHVQWMLTNGMACAWTAPSTTEAQKIVPGLSSAIWGEIKDDLNLDNEPFQWISIKGVA